MRIQKQLLVLVTMCVLILPLHSQTDKITFEITGKHDLTYDGERLEIAAPNLSIGLGAGLNLSTGLANTLLGQQTGSKLTSGINNTFLGYQAGANNEESGSVFIGYQAGINETRSNRLFISNSSTSEPLIHGNFDTKTLTINNNLFVTNDLYLPDYVATKKVNLVLDDGGKVVTKPIDEIRVNQFDFQVTNSSGFKIGLAGINIPHGTIIKGLKAVVMDNDQSTPIGLSNSVFVVLRRHQKYTYIPGNFGQKIYELRGPNTLLNSFVLTQTSTLFVAGANVIDNDNYIYFLEYYTCDDCQFREVTVME